MSPISWTEHLTFSGIFFIIVLGSTISFSNARAIVNVLKIDPNSKISFVILLLNSFLKIFCLMLIL